MNRRGFIRSLGIASAALMLRLRPESALPKAPERKYFVFTAEYDGETLLGYRGRDFLEAGYIQAPYMPLYVAGKFQVTDLVKGPRYPRPPLHPSEQKTPPHSNEKLPT